MENNCTEFCIGLTGRIFGHKYHDIFDIEKGAAQTSGANVECPSRYLPRIVDSYRSFKSTYVHSICKRCGKIVKR